MQMHLAVTFWGQEYRGYFLDFCLASLLAPGNLPAVATNSAARLLIATTDQDWAELQAKPTFVAAKKLISIEHVPFELEAGSTSAQEKHKRMLLMSAAHRCLARRMFRDRAQGIFLYPDTIAAKGLIANLEALWRKGASAIMFMNVRFANEGLINEIRKRGLVRAGAPLCLSSEQLVRLTLRHMHSEMRRSGFASQCTADDCSSYFWVVRPGEDLLFHCGGWIPLLIDYGSLQSHNDCALQMSTIDGMEYIAANFGSRRDIHFVRSSNGLFLVSFTPEASVHFSLVPRPDYRFPLLRNASKIAAAHSFLFQQAAPWFWKQQFRLSVRLCGGDSPEWRWRAVERKAVKIIGRMESGGSLVDNSVLFCRRYLSACWHFPSRLSHILRAAWINRRTICRRAIELCRGDRVAMQKVIWRLRHDASHLVGRSIPERDPTRTTDLDKN